MIGPATMIKPVTETPSKIIVYGVTGSGKTTAAGRIGAATGIAWHSVDDLTWEPGWTAVPLDEQRRRIAKICVRDEWIIDTAYGTWLDIPMARADLIIALDYPRWLSLARLLRRTIARVADRRLICNGNQESLRNMFSAGSILAWHFRSFHRKRRRIRQWHGDPAAPAVLRFGRPHELEAWITSLRRVRSC